MLGMDTETEHGRAVLLAVADASGARHETLDLSHVGEDKRAERIFRFLEHHADDDGYVGWNSDYDARAILAYAPRPWLELLARTGEGRWPNLPLDVRYVPGKVFAFRREGSRSWTALYDAQQYFGGSLRARAKIVRMRKGDPDVSWRALPAVLRRGGVRAARITRYCIRDARIVAALWEYVAAALRRIDVDTSTPYSPATLAARYFVPRGIRVAPWVQEIGERAYYGGRSEIYMRGRFRRVRYYDIHSAYPWALSMMAEWRTVIPVSGAEHTERAEYAVVCADIEVPRTDPVGPVPVRSNGLLVYPVGRISRYWCDLHTFRMLAQRRMVRAVRSAVCWLRDPYAPPALAFPQIRALYSLKESGPDLRQAAKLVLNGLSGKLAELQERYHQSAWYDSDCAAAGIPLRREWAFGRATNFVQAAHCTGAVRARIYEAIMRAPDKIIAVATDGLFSTCDLPLNVGPKLGQWGTTVIPDHIQIASGVYLHGRMQTLRGFAARENVLHKLRAHRNARSIRIRCGVPSTLLYSLRSGDEINRIGTWLRDMNLNCDRKRRWPCSITAGDLLSVRGAQTSAPLTMEDLCREKRKSKLKPKARKSAKKPARKNRLS